MLVKVLQPDPDLEAEGLTAGTVADMPAARARALQARGLVGPARARRPAENQARAGAPETT